MSELQRAAQHWKEIEMCFSGFKCNCAHAQAAGSQSCLDNFSKGQLRQFFNETYGPKLSGEIAMAIIEKYDFSAKQRADRTFSLKLKEVSLALHRHIWHLKEPLEKEDKYQRKFSIKWQLEGTEVCQAAWTKARGGADCRVGSLAAQVMRNFSPAQRESGELAKLDLAVERRRGESESARRLWTIDWWASELMMHEWQPDDQAVRFRGQGYMWIHKHEYKQMATAAGIVPLGYDAWRNLPPEALRKLHEEGKLPGSDLDRLKLTRSANHYNAPECTECQERRKAYLKAKLAVGADPAVVQEKFDDMRRHNAEWHADRDTALRLKYSTYTPHADACYECDDGCGSFWQALPVGPTGRDSKATYQNAKYHFAVQANVICGPAGVQRFTVLPKNVRKGANFGLTNFVIVLHRTWQQGRLGPHVQRAYRHTDGGPDNVSWVSHALHFILVYIGVFQDLWWFRFEAGHSHTEIADRLFGLMKKLFDSGCNKRVGPLETFAELEAQLQEVFAKAPELFELGFDFANWDFENWFSGFAFEHSDKFQPLVDGNFGGYAFDHVFRYEYVGEVLWQHGGVRVTYKHRLSETGTAREAEFKPIQRVMRSVPTQNGGMEEVAVNETTPNGVIFMTRPPHLHVEPRREKLTRDSEDEKLEKACERICRLRADDLTEKHQAFWKALGNVHTAGKYAEGVPTMPHTERVDGHAFTFTGCPRPLLPMLRDLRRFERPLITWDPFTAAPPPEFRAPSALQLPPPRQTGSASYAVVPLSSAPSSSSAAEPTAAVLYPGLSSSSAASSSLLAEPPAAVVYPGERQDGSASGRVGVGVGAQGKRPAAPLLRDPRMVNTVSHTEYKKSAQDRDAVQLNLEQWLAEYPGRVEDVRGGKLYIVELEQADGEFKLGLVATEGEVFQQQMGEAGDEAGEASDEAGEASEASEAGEELDDEPESVIKSKWFQRRKEDQIRWPKNPHFEHCPPEGDRAENDLPVECFLVEVADSDLTEGSVDVKWEAPKLKETFVKKLRALVEKYPRLKANEVPVYPTTSQAKQIGKPVAKARGPRTNRPRATSTTAQTDRKRRRRR